MPEYDRITAQHYAAWRPPLHGRILRKAFAPGEHFHYGLDVGCGTGYSTHALAEFCTEVVGIDPSGEMIELAEEGDGVRFLSQARSDGAIDQGFLDGSFDVITFAGSLSYQAPEVALEQISWLATEGTTILVYDFNTLLASVFEALGVQPDPGDYDHSKNFGADTRFGLEENMRFRERETFVATPRETGHLLLSVKDWREGALSKHNLETIGRQLEKVFGPQITLSAELFLTHYTMK